MDRFTFQAAGGADAAYTHVCVTRGWLEATGQLGQRDEIVTSIQAHPCNPATAAAGGFKVITLLLEEGGYPSLDALKAACRPAHRGADDQQSRRHGHLQPADGGMGAAGEGSRLRSPSTTTPISTA